MDNIRSSTVFYASFYESTKDLDNETFRESWEAILQYAFCGIEPGELSPIASMFYKMAKPNIDKNIQLRENGSKGGKPKTSLVEPKKSLVKPKKSLVTDSKPMVTTQETKHIYDVDEDVDVDVSEDEDVDVDVEADGEPADAQHIPLMAEIRKEVHENGYKLDGESLDRFVQYNRSKGWKMDWKKALKRWAEKEQPKKSPAGKFANFPQRDDQEHKDLVNMVIKMNEGN